jgi:preprotein translocase subunit SecD
MDKQLRSWPCVNFRRDRRVPFAAFQKVVLLIICVCVGCGTHADSGVSCPAIEVSAVADAPTVSTRSAVLNDSTKIPLTETPLVTSADITGATASLNGSQWRLNVNVTDEAAKRVHDFSAQHIGRTLALLVDGKVQGTPKIAGTITAKEFLIGEFKNREDAERLAAAMRNGCKR